MTLKSSTHKSDRAVFLYAKLKAISCREKYYTFFKDAWKVIEHKKELIDGNHIKFLCDILQHHTERVIQKLPPEYDLIIINIPPGMSKSSIVTKVFPAWAWLKDPSLKIITSSYSSTLSLDHAVKSRDIISSDWYKNNWGDDFELKFDQNRKSEYHNTGGGVRFATSTGGTLTGFHADIFIEDDPLNPNQAVSEKLLKTAINWNDRTVPSRILEGGLRILVMQRLVEGDPTGHELSKEGKRILHICLPATKTEKISPPEAKKLYTGDYLEPVRLDQHRLKNFKTDLGSYQFSGQYLQDPFPEGGGNVKKEWIEYISESELPNLVWNLWIDGAYTKSTANDPTGLAVIGFQEHTNRMFVKHAHSAFMELPKLLKFIPEYFDLHGLGWQSRIFIEPKASGKSLVQMINEGKLSAVEIKSKLVNEGKIARSQVASPKFEAGKIFFCKGGWNEDTVLQLTGFPNAKHDEYVDLIGYAVEYHYHDDRKKTPRML